MFYYKYKTTPYLLNGFSHSAQVALVNKGCDLRSSCIFPCPRYHARMPLYLLADLLRLLYKLTYRKAASLLGFQFL